VPVGRTSLEKLVAAGLDVEQAPEAQRAAELLLESIMIVLIMWRCKQEKLCFKAMLLHFSC
jgi:hypothetical protein